MAQPPQFPQSSLAEILAEAKLSLDKAVASAVSGESPDSLTSATLAKFAAAGNSSCTNNTGCSRPGVAAQ